MPNDMSIYMHSTPTPRLFERARRDFSHGCIRVQDPVALGHFVLRDLPEWTPEAVEEAMGPGKSRFVKVPTPIPAIIFYTTAIVGQDGQANFPDDLYKLDKPLEEALKARSVKLALSH